ncbi:MAG: hypothetical protein A3B99_05515 [Candidatus Yanofskybacteria bacterium RIFCSPHIGHO2_02_FULL_44_12b]|nr:MAG: hypothetical protein A3B99_05515 [Candidatus Yanofskybacteria bacterium RIFCSPHIGHO2_02_FULL_44_12b]
MHSPPPANSPEGNPPAGGRNARTGLGAAVRGGEPASLRAGGERRVREAREGQELGCWAK